jgi:hypothetical protein
VPTTVSWGQGFDFGSVPAVSWYVVESSKGVFMRLLPGIRSPERRFGGSI